MRLVTPILLALILGVTPAMAGCIAKDQIIATAPEGTKTLKIVGMTAVEFRDAAEAPFPDNYTYVLAWQDGATRVLVFVFDEHNCAVQRGGVGMEVAAQFIGAES